MVPAHPVRHNDGRRAFLLLPAGIAVIAGLDAALLRLGLGAPAQGAGLADAHGVLMVFGFVGTAISLERAVALQSAGTHRARIAYVVPTLSALAALTLLVSMSVPAWSPGRSLPGTLWTASLAGLTMIYVHVWVNRQASYAVLIQGMGAVSGMLGAALWTRGVEAAVLVPWWMTFLVLTIAGERLELARVAFASGGTELRITAASAGTLLASGLTLVAPDLGYPLLGLALGILMVDLALHDVARGTIRVPGLPRFSAACMLSGYAWGTVSALTWLIGGPALSGHRYDLVIHALTIGFVLSMIMAHAPVILTAVVRRTLPYHPVMVAVWATLQLGLLLRMWAGARSQEPLWRLGGTINVIALLAFILTTVLLTLTSGRTSEEGAA